MENEDHIELYVNNSRTVFHTLGTNNQLGWSMENSRPGVHDPGALERLHISVPVHSMYPRAGFIPALQVSNKLLEGRRRAECGILPEQRLASGQGESALSDSFRPL
jgi:hypothetical protein